jgi:hypothetical protein
MTTKKAKTLDEHMAVIAQELTKAALDYDLCDTFYDVVNTLNKKLETPLPVETPVRGYIVEVRTVIALPKKPTKAQELEIERLVKEASLNISAAMNNGVALEDANADGDSEVDLYTMPGRVKKAVTNG